MDVFETKQTVLFSDLQEKPSQLCVLAVFLQKGFTLQRMIIGGFW